MSQTFICEKCGGSAYEQFTYTQAKCLECGYLSFFDSGQSVQKEFELSPDATLLDLVEKNDYVAAPLIKRFVNYLIDILFIALVLVLGISLTYQDAEQISTLSDNTITLLFYLISPFYYVLMEYKFGKTVGKYFTKTKVISTNGNALTLGQCIKRALCRFIPFEGISGLISGGQFWHDSIPDTVVTED